MFFNEEIRVEQEFPRLLLGPPWRQWVSLDFIPVFLERGQPYLACSCNADLDYLRPLQVGELELLDIILRVHRQRGYAPILLRKVILVLVGLLSRGLALLALAFLAHELSENRSKSYCWLSFPLTKSLSVL